MMTARRTRASVSEATSHAHYKEYGGGHYYYYDYNVLPGHSDLPFLLSISASCAGESVAGYCANGSIKLQPSA